MADRFHQDRERLNLQRTLQTAWKLVADKQR